MPHISAVSKIELPHKTSQEAARERVREMFSEKMPQIDRLMPAFENTEIRQRNFVEPMDFYAGDTSFEKRNDEYRKWALYYSIEAITDVLSKTGFNKKDITDIIFVSTTGLATPSIDALIIDAMQLNPHVNRLPLWGLGCAGGVSGMAKAATLARANTNAVVLLVAVELCSLTLIKNDYSKSNFIGSSLFSDGVAACIITGDDRSPSKNIMLAGHSSKLYYGTEDIMGWEFQDSGFKVVFSKDIPSFIREHIHEDITEFLARHNLRLHDISNFIFHPGGTKVLEAYAEALNIKRSDLRHTSDVMSDHGNMSSATVLYVLEKFLTDGYKPGWGLMLAMGPGFSSEMTLLKMEN